MDVLSEFAKLVDTSQADGWLPHSQAIVSLKVTDVGSIISSVALLESRPNQFWFNDDDDDDVKTDF